MRILWINHRDPFHPMAGGAEVHLLEVGKRLVQRGHEVTLLAERFDGSEPEEEIGGIRVRRFGGMFTLHIYAPYFVKKNSAEFDVIIDDIAHAVPFWSPCFTRRPVVAIVHHVHQRVVETELNTILRCLVRRAERSMRETYENIITVSQTTKRDLVKQLGVEDSKIKVIYHGVDHQMYRPGMKFEEPMILWIGRMMRYKNLDHVIEAFKLVSRLIKSAKLILAGAGEEEQRIKSLVREKKLANITFNGRISGSDKVRLLQGAWCIVYTSEVEGWGMTILEAAACGTPAIAYKSGALGEAIIDGETGLLVNYGDVGSLAERLVELLRNEDLRKELSDNALRYSYNFTWDKSAEQTEEYLETILG